ncbi:hypothetical protein ACFO5R_19505 [Halosolutus amylolyticus]|uniref:Uncharacterized protein n=1 Tax=Halosolutus amylolyticus TaxID=2932267 RepID=A0ABD5PU24_9EURY|nr:hypothetical protein [Halosolutus amylolyticus]
MSRLERVTAWLRARPVLTVFLSLAAVPTCLAALSFRQPIGLPNTVLSGLELLFSLLVYAPVAGIRSWLLEPIGLDALFAVPGLQQTLVFVLLLGFYYVLSLSIVRIGTAIRTHYRTRT